MHRWGGALVLDRCGGALVLDRRGGVGWVLCRCGGVGQVGWCGVVHGWGGGALVLDRCGSVCGCCVDVVVLDRWGGVG